MAGLWARQPTTVSFLTRRPATALFTRPQHLGGLLVALAGLEPAPPAGADLVELLKRTVARPRANTNFYLLTHAGLPLPLLERMLRTVAARVRQAIIFPIVAAEEFDEARGMLIDPETGRPVTAPPERVNELVNYLHNAVRLGRQVGTPVEPLVVAAHHEDIRFIIPFLAGLS
jgi:hypothetical protein